MSMLNETPPATADEAEAAPHECVMCAEAGPLDDEMWCDECRDLEMMVDPLDRVAEIRRMQKRHAELRALLLARTTERDDALARLREAGR